MQPLFPRLPAGAQPHTVGQLSSATVFNRSLAPARRPASGPLDLAPTLLQPPVFYSGGSLETEWLKPRQAHSHGVQSTIGVEGKLAGFLESKDTLAGKDFKRSLGSLASLQVTNETIRD